MKKSILITMAALLVLLSLTGVAMAATPQDIYNDYAENGRLDNEYTDAELRAYLNDATIHQYGDSVIVGELDKLVRSMLERDTFPFTGFEMMVLLVGAVLVVGTGVALRRPSR